MISKHQHVADTMFRCPACAADCAAVAVKALSHPEHALVVDAAVVTAQGRRSLLESLLRADDLHPQTYEYILRMLIANESGSLIGSDSN